MYPLRRSTVSKLLRPRLPRKAPPDHGPERAAPTFVEVFAGCGGLSLGLEQSGWRGLFAIEKDRFAFETLHANFLGSESRYPYEWPDWLERRSWSIEEFLSHQKLRALRGRVDLIAGGPPCQGFSSCGRRNPSDPRNALVTRYIELITAVAPRFILLENVLGFTRDFKPSRAETAHTNFARYLIEELGRAYDIFTTVIRASQYGVPQARSRFILVGVRREPRAAPLPFSLDLRAARNAVLARRSIRTELRPEKPSPTFAAR